MWGRPTSASQPNLLGTGDPHRQIFLFISRPRCKVASEACRPFLAQSAVPGPNHMHATAADAEAQRGERGTASATAKEMSRRCLMSMTAATASMLLLTPSSQASKLPPVFDRAWEAIGGGPADLYFPADFLGRWRVNSVLTSVDLPLGPEFVPDLRVVKRAKEQDLNQGLDYQVAFIKGPQGRIITDRRYNTARLLDVYMGKDAGREDRITWNPADPNRVAIALPGGLNILTRVTRRSEAAPADHRLDTSEFFEQIYDDPERTGAKIKASQCFTKYKWREAGPAELDSGPAIVATQVVSDYLTPYDGEQLMMRAGNRPVVIYTYRMKFWRVADGRAEMHA